MALPVYASPLERAWHYTYLLICVLIFLFLIAPIIIIIPLSFNAEAYFTFTEKMLRLDPEGYSLRWYDRLLTFGMVAPDAPRDAAPATWCSGCRMGSLRRCARRKKKQRGNGWISWPFTKRHGWPVKNGQAGTRCRKPPKGNTVCIPRRPR